MSQARVAVAYSGGRDSTALLHATLQASAGLGIQVIALHVHHGLNAHAQDWLDHCREQCRRWVDAGQRLTFASIRIGNKPQKGESVEAWARTARYAALGSMARDHGARLVLLAHHRRDQAETVLLQALRGAGVAGLSGMPRLADRDGLTWARPWLSRSRDEVEAYVAQHGLSHIDDNSNDDVRFDRNRLRMNVWPLLEASFGEAESALAIAAGWAQEATSALAEMAIADLASIEQAQGFDRDVWLAFSSARRSNALRAWLQRRGGHAVSAAIIARLMAELPEKHSARWPLAHGELRLYRGILSWHARLYTERDAPGTTRKPPAETSLTLTRAGTYKLPGWGGALRATRTAHGGVALASLSGLVLATRSGAERFQLGLGRPPRSLKKQFQMAGIAEWQRRGPLLFSAGRLVFVPRLGIDARVLAGDGEPQVLLDWIEGAAAAPERASPG